MLSVGKRKRGMDGKFVKNQKDDENSIIQSSSCREYESFDDYQGKGCGDVFEKFRKIVFFAVMIWLLLFLFSVTKRHQLIDKAMTYYTSIFECTPCFPCQMPEPCPNITVNESPQL